MQSKIKILAVDDEDFNLQILETDLGEAGFEVICARDGVEALEILAVEPKIDVVVLDRMMPRLDGMEVLLRMKADAALRDIPVIMQTAAAQSHQVEEGIKAGAYYYLAKPYDDQMLIGIVRAALQESRDFAEMREEVRKHKNVLGLIQQARFQFRTLEEAKNVAYYIASCCPDPENTVFGLSELMINAVEHGNLGITYAEKSALVREGIWEKEVNARLTLPENQEKFASLSFELKDSQVTIRIEDRGKGFNWKEYVEFSPQRLTHLHGRGIALAKTMCFTDLVYNDAGNQVTCTLALKKNA